MSLSSRSDSPASPSRSVLVPAFPRTLVLLDRVAAIDHERLTSDVARALGGKERDRLRDLIGPTAPAEWRVQAGGRFLRRLRPGLYPPRLHRVAGDPARAVLDRDRAHQPVHRRLGSPVARALRVSDKRAGH